MSERTHLERTALSIASTMAREWEPGLVAELRTCIAQWRFGDALVIAAELDARERHACRGSVTTEEGRRRLGDAWLFERAAEIVEQAGGTLRARPERTDRATGSTRRARLGV